MSGYYPVSLDIRGKKCVVIGGGRVALRKVKMLLEQGADISLISPAMCPELTQLAQTEKINVLRKAYQPADLKGVFLVFACTDVNDVNDKVATDARRRRILVNVVDSPHQSDFIIPSCLHRGDLSIAVSTEGSSPALARKIRVRLEQDFGEEYASLTGLIKEVRSELKKREITISGEDWQQALDLDLLVGLLRANHRKKAKATLLGSLETAKQKFLGNN